LGEIQPGNTVMICVLCCVVVVVSNFAFLFFVVLRKETKCNIAFRFQFLSLRLFHSLHTKIIATKIDFDLSLDRMKSLLTPTMEQSEVVRPSLFDDFDSTDSTAVMVDGQDCTRTCLPEQMKKKRKTMNKERRKSRRMRFVYGTHKIITNKLCEAPSDFFIKRQSENDCYVCVINNIFAAIVVTREDLFKIADRMESVNPNVTLYSRDEGKQK
jgi:hypothetical protein